MKKILLVIDNLGSGGAQNQITLLAIGLKKRGFDVTIFTYFPQDFFKYRLVENDIKLKQISKNGLIGLNVVYEIIKLNKKSNFDLIISYLYTPNLYAAIVKVFTGIKIIISYRSKTEFDQLNIFRYYSFKFTNIIADLIVCNSFHEKDNWIKNHRSISHKLHTIYNMVLIPNGNKNIRKIQSKNILNVLSVGTLSPLKNIEIIIDSFGEINNTNQFIFKYSWVGRKYFTEPSETYYNQILDKLKKENINNSWAFFEPVIDLKDFFISNDILILASTIEGLPNVVCEAMSFGMPIIISNVLDHQKLVIEGINGYCFNPKDKNSLTEKINKFNNLSLEEKMEMSKNSINIANTLFSEEKFINSYTKLINSILIN